MAAWINVYVLLLASLLFLYFYVRSVSPATLEKVYGQQAYRRCARDRAVAMGFELLTLICYVVYAFYPLPSPLPEHFPWPWWASALIGLAIGVPSMWLMIVGLRDAGEEAVRPKKEHGMYAGIYTRLRHPQAVGEVFLWWVAAFFLHSPFLVVFSFIYIPIFLMLCLAEEQDLLWRYAGYAKYYQKVGAFYPRKQRSKTR